VSRDATFEKNIEWKSRGSPLKYQRDARLRGIVREKEEQNRVLQYNFLKIKI